MHTHTQVQDFINCISGTSSLYGLKVETLDSLVLSLLLPLTHTYEFFMEPSAMDSNTEPFKEPSVIEESPKEPIVLQEPSKEPSLIEGGLDLKMLLMQELLQNLRHYTGFNISPVSITNLDGTILQ